MKKIAIIYGTRPEYLKLKPIIDNFKSIKYKIITIQTGQQELNTKSLFNGKSYKNISLSKRLSKILSFIEKINNKLHFDGIIIQGDTLSTYSGALFGFLNHIPVFHIEAGLRTFDLDNPFPEEGFRQMISKISSLNFTPTKKATKNLINEGIPKSKIIQVGNTFIDYMKDIKPSISNNIIITCHRKENIKNIPIICNQINELSKYFMDKNFPYTLIMIKHPNKSISNMFSKLLNKTKNIKLINPLEHNDMINLINSSYLILTDSGGIQEEVAILKKPTFVIRKTSERMESIKSGSCKLIDTDITNNVKKYVNGKLKFKIKTCKDYGEYGVSQKIIKKIIDFYDKL